MAATVRRSRKSRGVLVRKPQCQLTQRVAWSLFHHLKRGHLVAKSVDVSHSIIVMNLPGARGGGRS
jgi:hypothetical protein